MIGWAQGGNQIFPRENPGRASLRDAIAGLGGGCGFFRASLGRRAARCFGRKALTFDVGFAALAFDGDPVLLTHEAVAIGRKGVRRNLESRPAGVTRFFLALRKTVKSRLLSVATPEYKHSRTAVFYLSLAPPCPRLSSEFPSR